MAVSAMVQKLNMQMNHQLYSARLSIYFSNRCKEQGLSGVASFLHQQAQNNITCMIHILNFIKQIGGTPLVDEQQTPLCHCGNLEERLQHLFNDYQFRQQMLTQLAAEARVSGAYKVMCFLKYLTRKQHQDGQQLASILEQVRQAKNSGLTLSQTDRYLLMQPAGHPPCPPKRANPLLYC